VARLRPDEIRNMSREEQNDELLKLESELVTERALASAGGAPERPGRIRAIRRTIARIKTIQRTG